jgi:hypothetical protein
MLERVSVCESHSAYDVDPGPLVVLAGKTSIFSSIPFASFKQAVLVFLLDDPASQPYSVSTTVPRGQTASGHLLSSKDPWQYRSRQVISTKRSLYLPVVLLVT